MPERIIKAIAEYSGDPWFIGMLSFLGGSFSGLANHLRSGHPLKAGMVLSAVLNSGIVALIVALMGFKTFSDNLPYLVGLSLLAGIGGATLLDFMVQIFKQRLVAMSGTECRTKE